MQENFRALHMRFDEDFVKMEFFSAELAHVPEEVLQPAQLQEARRVLPLPQVRGRQVPGVPQALQEEAGAEDALQDEAPRRLGIGCEVTEVTADSDDE